MTNTSIEMVLGILFLLFSNTKFQFGVEKPIWRFYITVKALPITSQIKLINKREFGKVTLPRNFETFVIYVTVQEVWTMMSIYLFRIFQIQNNLTLTTL